MYKINVKVGDVNLFVHLLMADIYAAEMYTYAQKQFFQADVVAFIFMWVIKV